MSKTITVFLLSLTLLSPLPALTQTRTHSTEPAMAAALNGPIDMAEINAKIRAEENEHSQIMHTLHFLTDVYGPRMTGTPSLKAAGQWAIGQMEEWGFQNGHLEPWDFGHPGWTNERFSAHIIKPIKDQLTCEVLSWTPGTNGTVTAGAFQMIFPENPTKETLNQYLDSVKAKVVGKIVFAGKQTFVPVTLEPRPTRIDDKTIQQRFDPNNQNQQAGGNRPGGGNRQGPARDPNVLTARQIDEVLDPWLVAHHVAVRVNDSGRDHGVIVAFNNRTFDIKKAVPTVVMRNEDYGRITRILHDGTPVTLEFNIFNHIYPEGKTAYNTVAEIPGSDKKDEVIMLGGHLDSWHSATGATDNAIGCATMMEAARILQAIGVKPRRTIRVALWSGEEEGLLGSQAYVKEHFGSAENPKPDFYKFGGYFNIDAGTGRARGASVFGPPEAATILREALAPFADLGVAGANANKSRNLGGSDNTSFSNAGLPGIGMNQDPIEYQAYTWHTNMDNYERIIEDDVKKSAIDIAAAVYVLAMRDEMLPRFSAADMPPRPAPAATPAATPGTSTPTRTRRPRASVTKKP